MAEISPIPDANPQITEETWSPVASVSFVWPFVSSELLQLAQAVGEQHVRQLLLSKAGHVLWLLQFELRLQTGQPAGGSSHASVEALLSGSWCRLFGRFTPASGEEIKSANTG